MVGFNRPLPIICVTGATASGKSKFAVELAKQVDGEIINADSVQIYRGFDIGSGKISETEMDGVPHHLISHIDPTEQYSAGRFRKEAFEAACEIFTRGKVPIVVGGTGLYINSIFSEFLGLVESRYSDELLENLRDKLSKDDFESWCLRFLSIVDSEALTKIGQNDSVRIQRAASLYLALGIKNSLCRSIFNNSSDLKSEGLVFVIEDDRDVLYERINSRVCEMWDRGWVGEVERIHKSYGESRSIQIPGLRSLGYREIYSALCQDKSLETFEKSSLINNIQRDTRRFAKRQRTWWRHQPDKLGWVQLSSQGSHMSAGLGELDSPNDKTRESSFFETLKLVSDLTKKFTNLGVKGLLEHYGSDIGLSSSGKSETNVIFERIFLN